MTISEQELIAQTATEHQDFLFALAKEHQEQAYLFSSSLTTEKKKLKDLCQKYGVPYTTPAKTKYAIYQAFKNQLAAETEKLHKIWWNAN